jgi:hypothetical protein
MEGLGTRGETDTFSALPRAVTSHIHINFLRQGIPHFDYFPLLLNVCTVEPVSHIWQLEVYTAQPLVLQPNPLSG